MTAPRPRATAPHVGDQISLGGTNGETPQTAQATQGAQSNSQADGKTPTADAAAGKPAAVTDTGSKTAASGNAAAQQGAAPAATPADAAAAPAANAITAHVETTASNGAPPSAQTATNAVKAATANLPTFGILTTNAATTQTGAAASSTAPAAAVSVAGLPVAIAARAQAGSNQFDIRLDPPELGRIDVRLDVDSNGQVTSHVTVDRPETLTLLQSQQPQLQRALEQAGLKTADNGLQFSLRDQSFSGTNTGGNNGGGTQSSPAQQLVVPDSDQPSVGATQIYSRWNLGSGIDITV